MVFLSKTRAKEGKTRSTEKSRALRTRSVPTTLVMAPELGHCLLLGVEGLVDAEAGDQVKTARWKAVVRCGERFTRFVNWLV